MNRAKWNDPDALEAEADAEIAKYLAAQSGESNETPQAGPLEDPPAQTQAAPEEDSRQPEAPSNAEQTVTESEPERAEVQSYEEILRKADERVKNTQARMTKATQEAAELRKRVYELEEKLAGLESNPKDSAELAKLEEDYPDIAKPLLQKIQSLEKRLSDQARESRKAREDADLEGHFNTILAAHSDFFEIRDSDDFSAWLNVQSPIARRVAASGTADEVVHLVREFKDFKQKSALQGTEKARSVAEPAISRTAPNVSKGKKVWTRAEIDKMPLHVYEQLEAEIDKAWAEGRIA